MHKIFATVLLLFSGQASAALIDFEEFTSDDVLPLESQSFTVSEISGTGLALNGSFGFGTPAYEGTALQCLDICTLSITHAAGSLFDLSSFDKMTGDFFFAQDLNEPYQVVAGGSFTLRGYLADGSQLNFFTVVEVSNYDEYYANRETALLSWQGLERLEMIISLSECSGACAVAVDNINITAVPVPAAFWLFGSGLAALGYLRRRP
jgi:hypothetical protein